MKEWLPTIPDGNLPTNQKIGGGGGGAGGGGGGEEEEDCGNHEYRIVPKFDKHCRR